MKKLLTLALGLITTGCATRGFPPVASIVNFDSVDGHLYRGGQPNNYGINYLHELSIGTVINLRIIGDEMPNEERECKVRAIAYFDVPFGGAEAPSEEAMLRVLKIIEGAPGRVFVHCQHGCDRTGTVVACYRICHGWSNADALAEAEKYGLSPFEFGMKRFIKKFK